MSESLTNTHETLAQRRTNTLSYIDDAIPDNLPNGRHAQVNISDIPYAYVQDALDMLWDQLVQVQSTSAPPTGVKTGRQLPLHALRRLATKLAVTYSLLPSSFYLIGVQSTVTESTGNGYFADIFLGEWKGQKVALKRLRVDTRDPAAHKSLQKQFCRESVLWKEMHHDHVLPFLGVSEEAFALAICMVLPWMERGNLRRHIVELRQEGQLSGHKFVVSVNRWLYQVALGLVYLHDEGVIHGDLHGANILVNDAGKVVLTDFGMGLLAEATPGNYGSLHGGGAYQFRAPELHDPEEFDMEDTRPTVASDVYSLACVAIELYTDRVPFGHDFVKVCIQIISGDRPPRPKTPDNELMPSSLWEVVNRCWTHHPSGRPTSHEIARELQDIVSNDVSAVEVPDGAEAKVALEGSAPTSRGVGVPVADGSASPSQFKVEEEAVALSDDPISVPVEADSTAMPAMLEGSLASAPVSQADVDRVEVREEPNPAPIHIPSLQLEAGSQPSANRPLKPSVSAPGSEENTPGAAIVPELKEESPDVPTSHSSNTASVELQELKDIQNMEPPQISSPLNTAVKHFAESEKAEVGSGFAVPKLMPPAPYRQATVVTENAHGRGQADTDTVRRGNVVKLRKGCFPFNFCCR